ncbi:hypothetical protein [Massilia brevitalea]|uniref:hypothetical protein n=1 Tax=Massilia brevitalea TaxID=442526 RepID=UPI0027389BB9|nr:hypothetical protein [Massilia brevitalea]
MVRPVEYDNLLANGTFKPAAVSKASIDQFMRSAEEMSTASKATASAAPRFTLAYEGMFNVVMAVLEFRGARPGDSPGHRATAIQRVAADLGLDWTKQSVLTRLHDSRNRVTYRQSVPPVTKADADAMYSVLHEMLTAATALISAQDNSKV